jgi:hypothetical protein
LLKRFHLGELVALGCGQLGEIRLALRLRSDKAVL